MSMMNDCRSYRKVNLVHFTIRQGTVKHNTNKRLQKITDCYYIVYDNYFVDGIVRYSYDRMSRLCDIRRQLKSVFCTCATRNVSAKPLGNACEKYIELLCHHLQLHKPCIYSPNHASLRTATLQTRLFYRSPGSSKYCDVDNSNLLGNHTIQEMSTWSIQNFIRLYTDRVLKATSGWNLARLHLTEEFLHIMIRAGKQDCCLYVIPIPHFAHIPDLELYRHCYHLLQMYHNPAYVSVESFEVPSEN